jgi:hypothetical protein
MKWLPILLCILAVNLFPQPNESSPKHKNQSTDHAGNTFTFNDNRKAEAQADTTKTSPPRWYTSSEWWLVIIAAVTGFAIAYQAREMTRATNVMQAQMAEMRRQVDVTMLQLRAMHEQITEMSAQTGLLDSYVKATQDSVIVAQKTLVLAQRPRIVVRMFYFSAPTGVGINRVSSQIGSDPFCSGQFYIDNCGGTDATIQEIYCTPYIAESLPMKRPWEGKIGSQDKKTIRPGGSIPWLFGLPVSEPLEMQTFVDITEFKTKNFYVLGWIGYTDALDIYRMTVFCRRYDLTKDRFVAVDDPDYEYAD